MNAWEKVLVEWCNCLAISDKIEDFNELRDGKFFTNILCIINKSDGFHDKECAFKNLLHILNNIYNKAQVECHQCLSFLDLTEDDLKVITSLLMHYTCIYDRRDILTSPLCHTLSKNTQECIKTFLQRVNKDISHSDLEIIIKEFTDKFSEDKFESDDKIISPLMGIFRTPVSKTSKFQDKDKEITKLKNMLDMERYEKCDLQEEIKLQNEKIKKFELLVNKKNTDLIQLKREITTLENRTPPHFRAIDPTDTEKRLKKEIQSLEHYIEKSEREQDDFREELYRSRKKLNEWELEYANLHTKYSEYEKQVDDLTKLSDKQAARITSLEAYCDELNGLLEELQAKPANESSMFETSSVNVRRSLNLAEENLACSVVEVQLKDAQKQNREMMMKIDSLNIELDNNKKMFDLKMNEYVTKYNKLREYTEQLTDIKLNINDIKHYCKKETKENINYINEIKKSFFLQITQNYEKSIEKLSTELNKEKDISQSLSNKLKDTLSKFDECNKEVEKIENDKRYLEENITQLEKAYTDLDEQKQDLFSKLSKSEKRNGKVLDEIESLEKDGVKYKYELDQLKVEKNKYISEIQSLENCRDLLQGINEDLSSKLLISEETKMEYIARDRLSQQTMESLNNELNRVVHEKTKHENELEILRIENKQLSCQNEDLSSKLFAAEESNKECNTKREFFQEEIRQKTSELNQARSEKEECFSKLEILKLDYQKVSEVTQDLTSKLSVSEETIKEYLAKIRMLEETIEEKTITYISRITVLEETMESLKNELNRVVHEKIKHENELEMLRIENKQLSCQIDDLLSKLFTAEESNKECNTKRESLEEDIRQKMSELNQVRYGKEKCVSELEILKLDYQKAFEVTQDLTSKLSVSEETIKGYLANIRMLEESIEQKTAEMSKVILEKDEYITQINNIQRDNEELTKRSLELSSENKDKDKMLTEKKTVENEYIQLIKTIAMYNEELDKVVKHLKGQQKGTEMSELQRSYNSFNKLSPVKSSTNDKSDEINQLGEQISKINSYLHLYSEKETFYVNEIDSLKGELATTSTNYFELAQNLKEQNCDNESMITSLTENLHSVIEKYNHLQVEHREYLNRVSEYQAEITKLNKTLCEVTLTNELKIINLQDEIIKLEEDILSMKKSHDNLRETHEYKMKLLKDKLSESEEEVNTLKDLMDKAAVEYNIKFNSLQENVAKLEEEKRAAEEELIHLKIEYMNEVEILRRDISNNEELMNSLKKDCEDYQSKINSLRVQIALAKQEISKFQKRSGRTEEEYESTLANLQVQVVSSTLEATRLANKIDALLVENEDLQRQFKEMEEEKYKEMEAKTSLADDLKKERAVIEELKKELDERELLSKEVEQLHEKDERVQQENKKYLEEKQVELQQKINTLIKSNEMKEEMCSVFKIYFNEFKENLDKLLSQKNILETLTNNLRILVVSINKNAPSENFNLKTLFEKKEAMEVIAEDIMKQYNRYSKQMNDIVFDVFKYYQRSYDTLLSTSDIKIENYSDKYNLEELYYQMSDLIDRTTDALDQLKTLQKDLEQLSKVEDVKVQKENILGSSRKINVDKMKEEEYKKKNLALRQKITLLENAKGNLEKTVKKLREENKKIKEGGHKTATVGNDEHYNMLLQEHVAYKEKHDNILQEYKTKLAQLQKEYEEHKSGCMRTSTPLEDELELPPKEKQHLLAELNSLREAYSSIRSTKAKLETENLHSKKLIEEQKQEIAKFNFMKEAYDKLLEENSKLMSDVDTMKYKRTRDRDEFLRLLRKERSESDARNAKLIQDIRTDYEAKLEKMKEKMIKLYREEVNKEMSKVKAGQHESSSLLKIIEQLKGDLFEAEQKVQVLETERDILRRKRDQSHLHSSRESFSSFQHHDSDARSLMDFPTSSAVAKSSAFPAVAVSSEFKRPNAAKNSCLDARRQSEVRRVSTLPRTGTVVEEVTVTRRTSFGVPDSVGPNLHMEDEEEMFNNKYLTDLKQGKCELPTSDDRDSRVSELAWRNSLVPPHLKSSYPAEMQFCSPGRFKEDDIKAGNLPFDDSLCKLLPGEKPRKKDFGTTSYKKPGPPTPIKNGGRLSLQGNEVHPAREAPIEPKRSTPGRIRALFTGRNSSKSGVEASPPKRRLNIFRR